MQRKSTTPLRARKARAASDKLPPDEQRITVEQAEWLVSQILKHDEDDEARALTALIYGIAYEPEFLQRDGLALFATRCAYTITSDCSRARETFVGRAFAWMREQTEGGAR